MVGGTGCRIGHGPLDEPKAGRALGLDLVPWQATFASLVA